MATVNGARGANHGHSTTTRTPPGAREERGSLVVIGERALVRGWSLAGAVVFGAEDAGAVREAWRTLAEDVAVVVLTPAAADALADEPAHGAPLTVVLPP